MCTPTRNSLPHDTTLLVHVMDSEFTCLFSTHFSCHHIISLSSDPASDGTFPPHLCFFFLLLAKNLHSRNVEHHHHQSTIVSNSIDNSSMRVRVHKQSLSHVIDDDEVDPRLLFLSVVVGKRKFHQIKVSNVTRAKRRRRKMDLISRYESRIYRHISTFFYYLG